MFVCAWDLCLWVGVYEWTSVIFEVYAEEEG